MIMNKFLSLVILSEVSLNLTYLSVFRSQVAEFGMREQFHCLTSRFYQRIWDTYAIEVLLLLIFWKLTSFLFLIRSHLLLKVSCAVHLKPFARQWGCTRTVLLTNLIVIIYWISCHAVTHSSTVSIAFHEGMSSTILFLIVSTNSLQSENIIVDCAFIISLWIIAMLHALLILLWFIYLPLALLF